MRCNLLHATLKCILPLSRLDSTLCAILIIGAADHTQRSRTLLHKPHKSARALPENYTCLRSACEAPARKSLMRRPRGVWGAPPRRLRSGAPPRRLRGVCEASTKRLQSVQCLLGACEAPARRLRGVCKASARRLHDASVIYAFFSEASRRSLPDPYRGALPKRPAIHPLATQSATHLITTPVCQHRYICSFGKKLLSCVSNLH